MTIFVAFVLFFYILGVNAIVNCLGNAWNSGYGTGNHYRDCQLNLWWWAAVRDDTVNDRIILSRDNVFVDAGGFDFSTLVGKTFQIGDDEFDLITVNGDGILRGFTGTVIFEEPLVVNGNDFLRDAVVTIALSGTRGQIRTVSGHRLGMDGKFFLSNSWSFMGALSGDDILRNAEITRSGFQQIEIHGGPVSGSDFCRGLDMPGFAPEFIGEVEFSGANAFREARFFIQTDEVYRVLASGGGFAHSANVTVSATHSVSLGRIDFKSGSIDVLTDTYFEANTELRFAAGVIGAGKRMKSASGAGITVKGTIPEDFGSDMDVWSILLVDATCPNSAIFQGSEIQHLELENVFCELNGTDVAVVENLNVHGADLNLVDLSFFHVLDAVGVEVEVHEAMEFCSWIVGPKLQRLEIRDLETSTGTIRFCVEMFDVLNAPLESFMLRVENSVVERASFPFGLFELGRVVTESTRMEFTNVPALDVRSFVSESDFLLAESVGVADVDLLEVRVEACGSGRALATDKLNGMSFCARAPLGTYSETGTSKLCPPGMYGLKLGGVNITDACEFCPAGSYNPSPGQALCRECPAGRASQEVGATSAAVCVSCAEGLYAPSAGSATCTKCPTGYVSRFAGSISCQACAFGESTPDEGMIICDKCRPGLVAPSAGSPSCNSCPPGAIQPNPGQQTCDLCPVGRYALSFESIECEPCDPGYFASARGSSECQECEAGTFSGEEASTCTQCPIGHYAPDARATECLECPPGKYAPAKGSDECLKCPPGSIAPLNGSSVCTTVQRGYTAAIPGLSESTPCPAGMSAPATGSTECTPCTVGTFSDYDGAPSCRECPPGSFAPFPFSDKCLPCPAGRFSQLAGRIECTACARGTYAPGGSATSCLQADEGHYVPDLNSDRQFECMTGTYASSPGSSQCIECRPGTFAAKNASRECTSCVLGRFAFDSGSSNCELCPIGRAAAFSGATACSFCRPGQYAPIEGKDVCEICPAGTYSSDQGASKCEDCNQGRFAASSGSIECSPCEAGWHAEGKRATTCLLCPVGSYAVSRGTATCTECPSGTSTSAPGASTESACEAGRSSCEAGLVPDPISGECVPLVCGPGLVSAGGGCVGCPAGQSGVPTAINGSFASLDTCSACDATIHRCPGGTSAPMARIVTPASAYALASFDSTTADTSEEATTSSTSSTSTTSSSTSSSSSSSIDDDPTLVYTLATGFGVTFGLALLSCIGDGPRNVIRLVDSFTLNHYTLEGKPLIRRRTVVGGILTVGMGIAVVGLATDSIISFTTDNDAITTSLVSTARAPIQPVRGEVTMNFAIVAAIAPSNPCPLANTSLSFPTSQSWTVTSAPPANDPSTTSTSSKECVYKAQCLECSVTTSVILAATFPWTAQAGTWALASSGAHLASESPPSPSLVDGHWGNSTDTPTSGVAVDVLATPEVRVRDANIGYGYVLTIEQQVEDDAEIDPSEGFVPISQTVTVRIAIKPASNALVTTISPRFTAGQAISLLIGAASGVSAFFGLLTKCCEISSRAVVKSTKNPDLNFAEAPVIIGQSKPLFSRQEEETFGSQNPLHNTKFRGRRMSTGPSSTSIL